MSEYVLLFQNDVGAATTVIEALYQCNDAPFRGEWVSSRAEGIKRFDDVEGILADLEGELASRLGPAVYFPRGRA